MKRISNFITTNKQSIIIGAYVVGATIVFGTVCGLISNCKSNVDTTSTPTAIESAPSPTIVNSLEDEFEISKELFIKNKNDLRTSFQESCKKNTDHAYSSEEEYRKFVFLITDLKSKTDKFPALAAAAGKESLDVSDIFNHNYDQVGISLNQVDKFDDQIKELKSITAPSQPVYDGTFHLIGNVAGSFKELNGMVVRANDNYYVIKDASSDSGMTHGYVKPTGRIVILNVGSGRPAQVVTLTDDIEYRQDQSDFAKAMMEYAKQVREYPQIKNKIDRLSLQRQKAFKSFEQAFQTWICSVK